MSRGGESVVPKSIARSKMLMLGAEEIMEHPGLPFFRTRFWPGPQGRPQSTRKCPVVVGQ